MSMLGSLFIIKNRLIAVAFLGCIACFSLAHAQAVQDTAQRLQQDQKERERQRELDSLTPPDAVKVAPLKSAEVDIERIEETDSIFMIDDIVIVGDNVLSASDTEAILKDFRHHKLGTNRINMLLRRLTETFVAQGFITTRAYLGPQHLATGVLTVTIIVGRVEAITWNGKTIASLTAPRVVRDLAGGLLIDIGVLNALPTAPGKVVNIADLEQGVEQLNRLRRNKVDMQIQPGSTPGMSIIALTNQLSDSWWGMVSMDNYGSRQTGIARTTVSIELDNVLGFQEQATLNYSGSLETNALVAAFAMPYGSHTVSYTGSISEYNVLIGTTALLYGRTTSNAFAWSDVVSRSKSSKFILNATLTTRRVERVVNDITLTPQYLTVARFGLNDLQRFTVNGQKADWTFDAGYTRGLYGLAASHDASNLNQSDAHSQFNKIDFTTALTLPLFNGKNVHWDWRWQINGQWSRVALFGSEQIFSGGMSSVRGFREGGISGDRGLNVRNEAVWSNAPEWMGIHMEPYVFLDGGRLELIANGKYQQLAGAGAGLRVASNFGKRKLTGEILLGQSLVQPSTLGKSRTVGLATLSLSF